jgi:primosomal protein N' (replication factor Y)
LRASERTYQLLQQVSGRAGREKDRGKVILQSYMPDNMLMKSLVSGSRDDFVKSETESRKRTNMPPYARLAGIIISGKNEREVAAIAKAIVKIAPITKDMQVLGPVPAPLYLLRGNYRYRILVRSARNINVQKWLKALIASVKVPASVKVKVDIDPYSFM